MKASFHYGLANVGCVELLEPRRLLSSLADIGWQNPVEPLDVNDDGVVTEVDAQIVLQELNTNPGPLPVPANAPPYYDVTGDGVLTP